MIRSGHSPQALSAIIHERMHFNSHASVVYSLVVMNILQDHTMMGTVQLSVKQVNTFDCNIHEDHYRTKTVHLAENLRNLPTDSHTTSIY